MNIILFGFKGCGKTHFGKRLAQKMKRPFIDTDAIIEELYARDKGERLSSREIYREKGEAAFRALEREAILTLGDLKEAVIALGGGAVLDPDNVAFLEEIGELVYLQAGPDTLRHRIFRGDLPAILNEEDPAASFLALYHERIPVYESIRAHRINTDVLDEAGVLAALRNILILEEFTDGL